MRRRRTRARAEQPTEVADEPSPGMDSATDDGTDREEAEPAARTIDIVVDELTLARSQLAAGLPALAEGTLRHRIAFLEADGADADDELDALRVLLAESLWRQARLGAARTALDAIRAGSPQRRLPIAMLIEAETLAAAGELDRAAGSLERVVAAVGVDAAYELRGGVPGRLTWPLPSALVPSPSRAARPPWSPAPDEREASREELDARGTAARRRLEEARVAYVGGNLGEGDSQMSLAVRLDAELAADGVDIMEPTLGGQPDADRLLLYGDLLRAAGRQAEADRAFDRASDRRS